MKATFRTQRGHYECLFGLIYMPTSFMDLMNMVSKSYFDQMTVAFIITFQHTQRVKNYEIHVANPKERTFMQCLRVDFCLESISFIGQVISGESKED